MSNPFLSRGLDEVRFGDRPMTLNGTIHRTGVLLLICLCAGDYAWTHALGGGAIIGAALGGLIIAMIGIFKAEWTPVLAPVYAVLEGLLLGGVALLYNARFPGIVLNAGLLTAAVLFVLLALYSSRIIKVTDGLMTGIFAATAAVGLVYFVTMMLALFGVHLPYIHQSGWIGIGISLLTTGIAAANLLVDFRLIEDGVRAEKPKYMEWYCAMGLLITLVWLYLELLRLLSKLNGSNK
jgi:uncharacterized YccA/Bax inhibitor family protein